MPGTYRVTYLVSVTNSNKNVDSYRKTMKLDDTNEIIPTSISPNLAVFCIDLGEEFVAADNEETFAEQVREFGKRMTATHPGFDPEELKLGQMKIDGYWPILWSDSTETDQPGISGEQFSVTWDYLLVNSTLADKREQILLTTARLFARYSILLLTVKRSRELVTRVNRLVGDAGAKSSASARRQTAVNEIKVVTDIESTRRSLATNLLAVNPRFDIYWDEERQLVPRTYEAWSMDEVEKDAINALESTSRLFHDYVRRVQIEQVVSQSHTSIRSSMLLFALSVLGGVSALVSVSDFAGKAASPWKWSLTTRGWLLLAIAAVAIGIVIVYVSITASEQRIRRATNDAIEETNAQDSSDPET